MVPASPGPDDPDGAQRRYLRAVFAADIANFSGSVSVNETNAVSHLCETRKVACEELDSYGGWLFGMPGDGIFALFESAIDAVMCALKTQIRLAQHPSLEGTQLRIGVHLGEVLFVNDLPFGEVLAVAARLESLADPGGILVSAAVVDTVSARISATFEERGVPRLKNIPRRIVTFSVSPPPDANSLEGTSGKKQPLDRTTQLDRAAVSQSAVQSSIHHPTVDQLQPKRQQLSTRPSAECLAQLGDALAVHLGPFARVIVERCSARTTTLQELSLQLELEIPNEDERHLFRARIMEICATEYD